MEALIENLFSGKPVTKNDHPAYRELLLHWETQEYADVVLEYEELLQNNPAMAAMFGHGPCITWIVDIRSARFAFISSNTQELLGDTAQTVKAGGLGFVNQCRHPEDNGPTWLLKKKIWDFLVKLPSARRKNYQFTHDYRLAKADGIYLRLLEQSSVLQQDSRGNITHVIGICSDISHLKKSNAIVAAVSSLTDKYSFLLTPEQDGFNPQEVLSKRELEIAKLISEGCSSKHIADKLCIGFHTVNTHRQNIIRKTNTRNTGEFIQFVMEHNLI